MWMQCHFLWMYLLISEQLLLVSSVLFFYNKVWVWSGSYFMFCRCGSAIFRSVFLKIEVDPLKSAPGVTVKLILKCDTAPLSILETSYHFVNHFAKHPSLSRELPVLRLRSLPSY